jgi:diguanylate cyclase
MQMNTTQTQVHPLEQVKRRVYLASCLVGLPVLLLSWLPGIQSPDNVLQAYLVFPLLLVFLGWFLFGLLRGKPSLETLEKGVLPVLGTFFVVQSVSDAYLTPTKEQYLSNIWTLLVLAPISYLIRPLREVGLWVSFLHLVFVLMAWLRVSIGTPWEGRLVNLILIQVLSGAVLALMYVQARYRELLLTSQIEQKALQKLAYADPLTGASNRRRMYQLLEEEVTKAEQGVCVLLLDLDHFKRINDGFGHSAGDEVLRQVVDLLKSEIRVNDTLGRWGGEEFMVLLPNTALEHAVRIADRLRYCIADLALEGLIPITASFGVAAFSSGERVEQWIDRADQALYQAKQRGRNTVYAAPPTDSPNSSSVLET